MTRKKFYCFGVIFLFHIVCAQKDSVTVLKEVIISDWQLRNYTNTQKIQVLNDSVLAYGQPSLIALLNFNISIHFRENGYGMVASPAFRGTSAQQTAVIWNGININSQLNGQTDFNTINAADFNSVSVRPGGGSVIYGSSAIGGSIHLLNELSNIEETKHFISSSYGSFNSLNLSYHAAFSARNVSADVSVTRNSSDNDFTIRSQNRNNINGRFEITGLNAATAVRIEKSTISFYTRTSVSDRNFSLILPTDTKTRYGSSNTANMLEFINNSKIVSRVKLAHVGEQYRYYPDIDQQQSLSGEASTWILRYESAFRPVQKSLLTAIGEYNKTDGSGSDISTNSRSNVNAALLFKHQIYKNMLYELGIRKEFSDVFQSPMLYSAGFKKNISNFLELRINASRNFRAPTLNDLFWINGGNRDLKPETSSQAEAGATLSKKSFSFGLTGYFINIKDMIQWLPGAGQNWNPQNVAEVKSRGAEAILNYSGKFQKIRLEANATYAYVNSQNAITGKQLIYVPRHKATAALSFSRERLSINLQTLFSGESFIRSDNNPRYVLDAYTVANLSIGYSLDRKNNHKIVFQVRNIFDEQYQVVDRRPFPGRNYHLNLTINL